MLRIVIATLQVISLWSLGFVFNGDINIKMDAPEQINAGFEMKVQIVIDKDELTGFSRFQMEFHRMS